MSEPITRRVAESLVAHCFEGVGGLPPVLLGSDVAELPEDYVAVTAATLSPDGTGGVRCDLAVTANVPGDASGKAMADAAEHAVLTLKLADLDAAALALYARPAGFVRAWECTGRDDTPTEGGRVVCTMLCSVTIPPCEAAESPPASAG